jgi:hypothetical protein
MCPVMNAQSKQDDTTTYFSIAYAWFQKLQMPKWSEQTEQLAQEHGVKLTEVKLDELSEGAS